jgi:AraC-like DNA-binding protein
MMPTRLDYTHLRLSTDQVPLVDRIGYTREVFGREVFNLDLEPDSAMPLHIDFDLHALPGLKLVTGTARGVRSHRSRNMLADGNDDLFLSLNEKDLCAISHRGREAALRPGDATLISCAEPVTFRRTYGQAIGLCVPRILFAHMPGVIEDQLGRLIPANNEPLRLLRFYTNSVGAEQELGTPALRHLVVSHIHDLLSLVINGAGDAAEQAMRGGLRAARLRQIKSYVAHELTTDLSIQKVAQANQLSERHIQRLFEEEGTTFSVFVSRQRLARAFQMLRNPRHAERPIGAIAYECGFGDVTHFNRVFRQLYDMTPRDVRALKFAAKSGNIDDV